LAINESANAAVQKAIERAIGRGEIGVQVAAYLGEDLVIDAWGGLANPETGRLVDGDTLFNVFSVTKGVAATALHIQAERGHIDYDAPVAAYWPDYGVNGKERATVRDALSHRTGTPQMPSGVNRNPSATGRRPPRRSQRCRRFSPSVSSPPINRSHSAG